MRIFLVEDADPLRRLFARILEAFGHQVWEASDGLDALACLNEFRPELVLSDIMMPGLDGIGLIRRLRGMPDLEGDPVLVMTAAPNVETERDARQAGASEFLAEPLDAVTLFRGLSGYGRVGGSSTLPKVAEA